MYIPSVGDVIKFRAYAGRLSYKDLYGTVIVADYNGGNKVEDDDGKVWTVLRRNVLGQVGTSRAKRRCGNVDASRG